MSSSSKASAEGEWRAATDSKSGRTYYYHTKTKATTWSKPLELATPEERKSMIEQKEKTMAFFREMESNIMNKISEAEVQDERNRDRFHLNRSSSVGTDDGFYYLDEREGMYELNEAKEAGICNRNVHFSQTASTHNIDTMKIDRMPLVRQSSGSGDLPHYYGGRDSSVSYDANLGHFDPKMTGRTRKNSIGGGPPRRIRTISTMDDEILLTMRRGGAGTTQPHMPGNVSGEKRAAYFNAPASLSSAADDKSKYGALQLNRETSKELGDRMADRYPVPPADVNNTYLVEHMNLSPNPAKKPRTTFQHKRRNSTGTIFLENTMSNQDNNATIECVCVVIRAHMIDAAKENVTPLPEYDVFKDTAFQKKGDAKAGSSSCESNVPSLSTVKDFFQYLFSKSQLESDTIIMALIYCERLVKETKGKLCIRYDNWRSILFACLVMASKVWDDLSMWNVDFSQVYPSFDLRRVNTLELAMLDALKYVIRVSASEYAKYYFHLRSMMARLGLYQAGDPNLIRPLDLTGARKLQLSTEKYLEQSAASLDTTRRRFYSVHETTPTADSTNSAANSSGGVSKPAKSKSVGLEQLVSAEHMDADGQVHTSKKVSSRTDSKNTPKKAKNDAKEAK